MARRSVGRLLRSGSLVGERPEGAPSLGDVAEQVRDAACLLQEDIGEQLDVVIERTLAHRRAEAERLLRHEPRARPSGMSEASYGEAQLMRVAIRRHQSEEGGNLT